MGVKPVGDDDRFAVIGVAFGGGGFHEHVVLVLSCIALRFTPEVAEETVERVALSGLLLLPLLCLLVLFGDFYADGVALHFLSTRVAGYARYGLDTGFGGFQRIGEGACVGAGLLAVDETDGL